MNSETPTGRSPLIPNLLLDAEDPHGVDLEFLAEVVKLFEEQDDLKPAIITTVEQMSQELSAKTMNDDYKPYVAVRIFLPWSHDSCTKRLVGTQEPRSPCRYRICHC